MVIDPINDREGAKQQAKDSQLPPIGFGSTGDGVISTNLGGEPQNQFHTPIPDAVPKPIQLHDSYQDKINNMSLPKTQTDLSSGFDPSRYAAPKNESPQSFAQESPNPNKNTEAGNVNSISSQAETPKNNLSGDYGQNADPNATGDFTYFLKNPDASRIMNADDMRDRYSQEQDTNKSTSTEPPDTGESDIS